MAIVLAGYFLYVKNKNNLGDTATSTDSVVSISTLQDQNNNSQADAFSKLSADYFSWMFKDIGEDPETFAPRTSVALKVSDKTYDLGIYNGSCFEIEAVTWEFLPNEKAAVICWWAGGGNEIGVFQESQNLVVKIGQLDEGSAETPSFRGNFKEVLRFGVL